MILTSDVALVDGTLLHQHALAISDTASDGTIVDAGTLAEVRLRHPDAAVTDLGRRALLPGTVNAHNHSFQSLLRGIGDDQPFLIWRDRALYKYGPRLGAHGVYVGALFAFAEMALHGVTTVCDFFYVNDDGNDNAEAVIRAAERVGIRLILARCFYDWDGAPTAFRETIPHAVERFESLQRRFSTHATVSILAAPHSLHGASEAMIRAGAACARQAGVPWHIHLAEENYQIAQAVERYDQTPLRAVEKMGLLDEHMIAVHGCWFDAGERALLAERGAGLAYNPNSNMFLGDGVTDIVDLVARGVRIGLGTDGGCSNSRVSVFDEMRACALLQKVSKLDGQALTAERCFEMGTAGGGQILGLPVGRLAIGQRADVTAIDLDDPSVWPEEQLVKNVVYALSARAITDTFVGGRPIVRDRQLVALPLTEVRDQVRQLTGAWQS